jgi:hypothetical protein
MAIVLAPAKFSKRSTSRPLAIFLCVFSGPPEFAEAVRLAFHPAWEGRVPERVVEECAKFGSWSTQTAFPNLACEPRVVLHASRRSVACSSWRASLWRRVSQQG